MQKRGLSNGIIVVLLVMMAIVIFGILIMLFAVYFREQGEITDAETKLMEENVDIKMFQDLGNGSINITIQRGPTKLILVNVTEIDRYSDIVFIVDSTESMGEEINATRDIVEQFANRLQSESVNARLSLVEFKDYPQAPCGTPADFQSRVHQFSGDDFTQNVLQFKNELSLLNVHGGGDLPESHLTALADVAGLDFRENAQKVAILLSDAPPHAKDCLFPSKQPLDIALVLDTSRSMKESGWTMTNTVGPVNVTNVNLPTYSSAPKFNFSVPPNTSRVAFSVQWYPHPNYTGSSGAYVSLSVWRPNGGLVTYAVQEKVDPPDSIGAANEYYSGLSTNPQIVYVENPVSGNWTVQASFSSGWTGGAPYLPANITFYLGDNSTLIRNPTIRSHLSEMNSSSGFVSMLNEGDRSALIYFNATSGLLQNLTTNKSATISKINSLSFYSGTNIGAGINNARQELSRDSPERRKVMILLTDGQDSSGPWAPVPYADEAKAANITIFTIGLTNFVNHDVLRNISSSPSNYYYAPDGSALGAIYSAIVEELQNSTGDGPLMPTNKSCYLGPEYISNLSALFTRESIRFYYINRDEGLCKNTPEPMKGFASATGGESYTYQDASQVSSIISGMVSEIIKVYASESLAYFKIVFYNSTTTMSIDRYDVPQQPYESKKYELRLDPPITNITKVEVYAVMKTPSGKLVISHNPLSVWVKGGLGNT